MAETAAATVLLSTFHGAPFLSAQLASLHAQRNIVWDLLWRDDGSTDGSPDIVRAAKRGRELPSGTLGVAASFWALLRAAPIAVVAFCDQDDVWLPDKLARGYRALQAIPAEQPALYCAAQTLVDADLRPVGASPRVRRPPVFPMPLAQNIATGCTVMLNAAAVTLVRDRPPPPGSLHDWWCYLLVSAAGGRILVDPTQVILYRQHEANVVGAPTGPLGRGLAALRRGSGPFMTLFQVHVAALRAQRAILTPDAAASLDAIAAALAGSIVARARMLPRLRRQGWAESALFALWFVRKARGSAPGPR